MTISRQIRVLLGIIALLITYTAFLTTTTSDPHLSLVSPISRTTPVNWDPSSHHAIITNKPYWHEDVWLWLAGSLKEMGVDSTVYTECDETKGNDTCVRFGLLDLARDIGLWDEPIHKKKDFFEAINRPLSDGRFADLVFLATELDDMPWASSRLLKLWHERPPDQKFNLVAMHHAPSNHWKGAVKEWAPTGALSFLTISDHVTDHLLETLRSAARYPEYTKLGYEHLDSRVVVPFMPVSDLVKIKEGNGKITREDHEMVSRVAIVGKIEQSRRDYRGILDDLRKHLRADPTLWGYTTDADGIYQPIDALNPNTFRLLLLGEKWGDLPQLGELQKVVEVLARQTQEDFYEIMARTDMVLPAWHPDAMYYDSIASGGMVRSLEVGVPVLTTSFVISRYSFLTSSTSVVRPQALSDFDSIRLFRKYGHTVGTADEAVRSAIATEIPEHSHWRLADEVEAMLRAGWQRSTGEFEKRRREVADANRLALIMTIQGGS